MAPRGSSRKPSQSQGLGKGKSARKEPHDLPAKQSENRGDEENDDREEEIEEEDIEGEAQDYSEEYLGDSPKDSSEEVYEGVKERRVGAGGKGKGSLESLADERIDERTRQYRGITISFHVSDIKTDTYDLEIPTLIIPADERLRVGDFRTIPVNKLVHIACGKRPSYYPDDDDEDFCLKLDLEDQHADTIGSPGHAYVVRPDKKHGWKVPDLNLIVNAVGPNYGGQFAKQRKYWEFEEKDRQLGRTYKDAFSKCIESVRVGIFHRLFRDGSPRENQALNNTTAGQVARIALRELRGHIWRERNNEEFETKEFVFFLEDDEQDNDYQDALDVVFPRDEQYDNDEDDDDEDDSGRDDSSDVDKKYFKKQQTQPKARKRTVEKRGRELLDKGSQEGVENNSGYAKKKRKIDKGSEGPPGSDVGGIDEGGIDEMPEESWHPFDVKVSCGYKTTSRQKAPCKNLINVIPCWRHKEKKEYIDRHNKIFTPGYYRAREASKAEDSKKKNQQTRKDTAAKKKAVKSQNPQPDPAEEKEEEEEEEQEEEEQAKKKKKSKSAKNASKATKKSKGPTQQEE